jgi:hypothetical protein
LASKRLTEGEPRDLQIMTAKLSANHQQLFYYSNVPEECFGFDSGSALDPDPGGQKKGRKKAAKNQILVLNYKA